MSETTETPETTQSAPAAADPLLDRNASLAELGAHWASLASKPGTVEPGRVVASGPEGVIVEVAAGRGTLPAAASVR